MTTTKTYLTIGLAVFVSNVAYHLIDNSNQRISNVEEQISEVRDDVAVIKQVVLTHTPIAIKYNKNDVECLARNIYWEAGVEDMTGKIAVGNITVNRVKTKYWGSHICDVVYSPAQFSWTKQKRRAWVALKGQSWEDSQSAARAVLDGIQVKKLNKALFYHADYVSPTWKDNSKKVLKVGRHIFYTQALGSTLTL